MKQFFQCSDCAKHFTEMATTPEALAVSSHREAVLWMWRAHNQVRTLMAKCSSSCPRSCRKLSAGISGNCTQRVCWLPFSQYITSRPCRVRACVGGIKAQDSDVLLCALPGAAFCRVCCCKMLVHQTLCFMVWDSIGPFHVV